MAEVGRVDILFGLAYPDARVRRAALALADAGWHVRVLAWDRSGRLPRRAVDGEIRVEHARVRSRDARGWTQTAFLARVASRHLAALRRDPPDVIHAVDLPMLAMALMLRPWVGRPRIVYDAFEIYELMQAERYPRWVVNLIGALERWLPARADLVVVPGEGRATWFGAHGIRSVVVGNWVNAPESPPDRGAARRDLGIEEDAFCIAYAGGLEPERDVATLLDHARRKPRDVVIVAGRGEQEPLVRAVADEHANVTFLEWLPDPSPIYAAADCIYYALHDQHPYAKHAAPNNLYFAIAFARPLIHRGQGEIGILASMADIGESFTDDDSLTRAIERLRTPSRRSAAETGLRGLQASYSARHAADELRLAYARLVGKSHRRDQNASR